MQSEEWTGGIQNGFLNYQNYRYGRIACACFLFIQTYLSFYQSFPEKLKSVNILPLFSFPLFSFDSRI